MTEELLNTVVKLYKSKIEDNIYLADNIVRQNGYDGRQASIIYKAMYNGNIISTNTSVIISRMFYTLLSSKERSDYEKQQKNETII